ncbi:MAG: hypothetical protein A2Z52_00675 [Candidatus Moranbacteria bacterium RBG_19FT_COMBO_42_6]|nr:MAG: hypothetical protein A2Z52_00675 [Candidatus Moranbacteria bacterium RBG_19FT_COMBO_42_6]
MATKGINVEENSIHLRAVKYGYQRPNGFMYDGIKKHYSKRPNEWGVVKKFLVDASENQRTGQNQNTPFILLERSGNLNYDQAKYTLSYEAFFNYLDYLELMEARKNAQSAFQTAIIAITISVIAMAVSIYYSIKQINSPVKIDVGQYQKIIDTFKK